MKYEYSKIENYCLELEKIGSDIQKQLDEISSIFSTIDHIWTGEAAENFEKKVSKISMNFDDFYDELRACNSFLMKSSDSYEGLDVHLQQELNDIISTSNIFI